MGFITILLTTIVIIFIIYFFDFDETIFQIMMPITFFLLILAGIYLSTLFIYKLIQINKATMNNNTKSKENDNDDMNFVSIITKTSILTIISVIATLINVVIGSIMWEYRATDATAMLWRSTVFIDTLTNFCCIILTNNFANKYYLHLCGCIDNQCRKKFFKLTQKQKYPIINQLSSYVNSEARDIQ